MFHPSNIEALTDGNGYDIASAAEVWAMAGFHPIELHGLSEQGQCTCGHPERHADGRGAGKHPAAPGWQTATLDLSALLERLRHSRAPRNVGLRMGVQPGGERLLAIDDDGGLEAFEAKHGALPQTLTLASGGGGKHRLFRVPADVPFKNSVRVDGLAVDLRCDGGQIVVAPSLHASGSRYSIAELLPVAELPDHFVELLRDKPAPAPAPDLSAWTLGGPLRRQSERVLAYCRTKAAEDPSVQGANGSAALARWSAAVFWKLGLSEAEGLPLLREMNAIGASPSWSESELRHAMQSGAKAHESRPGARGHLLAEWATADEMSNAARGGQVARLAVAQGESRASVNEPTEPRPTPHLRAVREDESAVSAAVFNDEACLAQTFYDPIAEVPMSKAPEKEAYWLPVLPDPPSHKRDVSNAGVAEFVREYLEHHLPGRILFDRGSFWLYADGCWRETPEAWIESLVTQFHYRAEIHNDSGKQQWAANIGNVKSVVALMKHITSRHQHNENLSAPGILARSPCLAVFGTKGIYMHDSGRPCLSKASPGLRARHAYPFEYAEGQQPEHLLRVMRLDWFRGVEETEREKRIQCLREFIGHCLLGSLPIANIHKMLFCIGNGNDGKSVLMNIVRACMPPGSCASVNPQSLDGGACGGEFNRAALEGKAANLVDDLSAATISESAAFKSAVTFAPIEARRIRQEAFSFAPRAAWWANVNPSNGKLPKLEGQSGGMLRRFLCIEFPNSVRPGKETRDLAERILGLERAEFVCWAVEAALDMLIDGRTAFTTPDCHERILDIWKAGSLGDDAVSAFVRHACRRVESESEWTAAQTELYPQFVAWAAAVGGERCPFLGFMKKLRAAGVVIKRAQRGGQRERIANIRMEAR